MTERGAGVLSIQLQRDTPGPAENESKGTEHRLVPGWLTHKA